MYKLLGYLNVAILVLITAPFWLRTINGWTIKTKDKRFFNVIKFLRKLHKPLGVALVLIALLHGYLALGTIRLHTGVLVFVGLFTTMIFGGMFYKKKDKRLFKAHKALALISVLLLIVHLLWPGALWSLFRV